MALTAPPTFTKAQMLAAAVLNTYRDNMNALRWTANIQSADLVKNNDDALADLAGMAFPVLSGETWVFVAHSFFISNNTAAAKWAVTAPGSSTGRYGAIAAAAGAGDMTTTTFGTGLQLGVSTTLTDNAMVYGIVTAGGNGTIQVQAAQFAATVLDTTFYENSFILAARI